MYGNRTSIRNSASETEIQWETTDENTRSTVDAQWGTTEEDVKNAWIEERDGYFQGKINI